MTLEQFIRTQPANARIGACLKRFHEQEMRDRVIAGLRAEADRLRVAKMACELERALAEAVAADPSFLSHAGLYVEAA